MSELFDALPTQISIDRQIACVERELKFRRWVYPARIKEGKMKESSAAEEIAAMEAVRDTLRAVKEARS